MENGKWKMENGNLESSPISNFQFPISSLPESGVSGSAWDRILLTRHPQRPYTLDYLERLCTGFVELHGDRLFGDDPAIVGGLALLDGNPVVVMGHQKGRNVRERQFRNFGQARPEGYRKALRLMKLAEKFRRPVICFIDTPGAACLTEAEERGISEALARNQMEMARLAVPIVVAIIGEGVSGGAIGLGVGDHVIMQEHAIYSVILPEACASILWRDVKRAREAAEALKLSAQDARRYGLIDEIVPEPLGGAHQDYDAAASPLKAALVRALDRLQGQSTATLLQRRYEKFRQMGEVAEENRRVRNPNLALLPGFSEPTIPRRRLWLPIRSLRSAQA
jgi:acetyl-CoA carboxylase carboxyl transferase subunit alpha